MVKRILAVVAGYLTMALLTAALTMLVARMVPEVAAAGMESTPPAWYMLLNLAYGAVFAVVGGFVTAIVSPEPKRPQVLLLAGLLIVLSVVYLITGLGGVQPWWYLLGLVLTGGPAAYLDGMIQLCRRGSALDNT